MIINKKWEVRIVNDNYCFAWINVPFEICNQICDISDSIKEMLEICISNPNLFKIVDVR